METNCDPTSLNPRAVLFPAYSSEQHDSKTSSNVCRSETDWLCNSSYTPNTDEKYEIVSNNFLEGKDQQEKVELSAKRDKIPRGKKQKKDRKKHKRKHLVSDNSDDDKKPTKCKATHTKSVVEEVVFSHHNSIFKIDGKCDLENIYFESLGQKDACKYKLFCKIPIGCGAHEKDKWYPLLPTASKDDILRYFSKKSLKVLTKYSSPEEISKRDSFSQNKTLNFIPLPFDCTDVTQSDLLPKSGFFDGISSSWRPGPKKDIPKDLITDDEKSSEIKSKIVFFNKSLTESPHNIELWLEFVRFQDDVFASSEMIQSESQLVQKKVAILDRALQHNPKSIPLNITKLDVCRDLWSIEEVMKSWDSLIFLNPNNPQIWQKYVVFVLTNLTYFNMQRVLKVFSQCIRTLSDIAEGVIRSHTANPDLPLDMIEVVSNLCFVLASCGYTERAVAAFQALIEFNLFAIPSSDDVSISELVTCFEPFWDCGAPRFGEEGAIGWAETVSEKKISYTALVSQSDFNNEEEDILEKKLSEPETWLEFEKLRDMHQWLPWRPNPEYDQTDDDIDDIDRTVPFENISKFMFRIKDEQNQFLLLDLFITFLGFNPHTLNCMSSEKTSDSTYLRIGNFDKMSKDINDQLLKTDSFNPFMFTKLIFTAERIKFIQNVFLQGRSKLGPKYKTLLSAMNLKFLQVVSHENGSDAKKFAKTLLKEPENRNCLLLWLEYVKMEISGGAKVKAKKTAETLLTSSSLAISNNAIDSNEVWYFIRSYTDLCLNMEGNCRFDDDLLSPSELIWILVHLANKEKLTPYDSSELIRPVSILKAVSGFKTVLEQSVSFLTHTQLCGCLDPCAYSPLDCAKCFAYLQYFTNGIQSAIQVLKETANVVQDKCQTPNKKFLLKQLCCFQAEFLNFHRVNSNPSLKLLQQHLCDSICNYPDSFSLLYALVKLKSASSVINPTRRFFARLLRENKKIKPVTWILVLASELSVSSSLSERMEEHESNICCGIKWKIRSLFERALSSSECRFVSILWRSYMKFEVLNKEIERAKSIFLRALQNCGWCKDLLLDGIAYFPEELKQTVNFMVEKQIRIHTPLEEIQLLMSV